MGVDVDGRKVFAYLFFFAPFLFRDVLGFRKLFVGIAFLLIVHQL